MTVQAADVRDHVQRMLSEESGLLDSLEQLLKQEAVILRGDDVSAIERIGSSRQQCTSALTRLEAERADSCKMLSFGAGRDEFERLLQWCDPSGELRQAWQRNLTVARRCRDQNDRNGAVVTAKLNHVQRMIEAIRGTGPAPVYAPQAQRYARFPTRELGQA
jgi:flagellar biosynthesis/type III secretory pathway chaperone